MTNTLVLLISEQPIPNLLFLMEKQKEADRYLFVTTAWMERSGAADRLAEVAELKPGSWQKVPVVEDSLDDVRLKLQHLGLPAENKFLINLAGGTKIMSIGVSRFFEEYLQVYGFSMLHAGLPAWATEALAERMYRASTGRCRPAIRELLQWQQNNRNTNYALPPRSPLMALLDQLGWRTLITNL